MTTFRALGQRTTEPSKELDVFPKPANVTLVRLVTDEMTSLCPVTRQPDFNHVEIEYEPDQLCVETKSLKLYFWSFRDEAKFAEALSAEIAEQIDRAVQPHRIKVTLTQNVRGGIRLTAVAERVRVNEARS